GTDQDRRVQDAGDSLRPVVRRAPLGDFVARLGPQQLGGERLLERQVTWWSWHYRRRDPVGELVGAADPEVARVPTGGVEVGDGDRVHSPGHRGGVTEGDRVQVADA